ncbi:MAG: GNAT family N-acetyltransferase [Anaerolineae bacterium]
MDTELVIRRAGQSLQEAVLLRNLEQGSLGDSAYDTDHFLKVLESPVHTTYLAWYGHEAVGFCSCFETYIDQHPQLELDLLGVLPVFHNHGIGTRLVQVACIEAASHGIQHVRAVVADDNLASQRVFSKAGLQRSLNPVDLMVYRLQGRSPRLALPTPLEFQLLPHPHALQTPASRQTYQAVLANGGSLQASAVCVQVMTLSYTGFWIEHLHGSEEDTIHLVRSLFGCAAARHLDEVGVLCTDEACPEPGQFAALWRAGYESLGYYYVYRT